MNNTKKIQVFFLLLFTALCIFLTLNKHSRTGTFTYNSEIWADKAGYYVYLPAFFIYDFNADQFPKDIVVKTGNGFQLEDSNHIKKIYTKYPCGVALLQAPFFLVNHGISKLFNVDESGFSISYHKTIDIAAIFYLLVGLLCLSIYLQRYVSDLSSYITLGALFLGTNLYYYGIDETGMSHTYSFCLFSIFLLLADSVFQHVHSYKNYLLFGLITGLIVVVRPMNILFLPVFFIIQKDSIGDLMTRMYSTPFKYYIACLIPICIVIIPQLLYWKYISGSFFHYSYTKEGFTNIYSPKLLLLWFSTDNGLFTYSPLVIFSLIGFYTMRKEKPLLATTGLVYFIGISYLFASWWCWNYGCSYGSRPFVEYYAFFALPFAYLIEKWKNYAGLRIILFCTILLCIIVNLKLCYSFDGCWYGGPWDWNELKTLLLK